MDGIIIERPRHSGQAAAMSMKAHLDQLPARLGRPTTRTDYIPQIDGLRFIAIALVALWHASLRAARYIDELNRAGGAHGAHRATPLPNLYGVFPHGEVAVGLFFFISGFIIAQPFLLGGRRQSTRIFYWRRFRRIYPPYLIMLAACLLLVVASGPVDPQRLADLGRHFLVAAVYANGLVYGRPSPFDPPMWSLEVEVQFYLLTPFLMAGLLRLPGARARRLTGAALVLAAMLAASLIDMLHPYDGRFAFGLLAHLYLFLAGILVADLLADHDVARWRPLRGYDLLFLAGCAAASLLGLWLAPLDARPGGGIADLLTMGTTLAAVLAMFFGGLRGRVARAVLANRWVCLLGTMCFSLYLVHVVVMQIVAVMLLGPLHLASTASVFLVYLPVLLLASLVAGVIFYVMVERPFMTGRYDATFATITRRRGGSRRAIEV